jgi:hypothetical protein
MSVPQWVLLTLKPSMLGLALMSASQSVLAFNSSVSRSALKVGVVEVLGQAVAGSPAAGRKARSEVL